MKPTARQLIESISWSLEEKVVPVTEDKWAASTLRSVQRLLEHLALRVDIEGELLFEDNGDARATLGAVRDSLASNTDPGVAAWAAQVTDTLSQPCRAADAYPSVASLSEENHRLRALVDDGVRILGGPARQDLEGYVRRRLSRDQPLFAPFMANVF